MAKLRVDGREYWVGWHPKLGLMVHSNRWQGGVASDRVRLLVVAELRMGLFDKEVTRGVMQDSVTPDSTDRNRAMAAIRRTRPLRPVLYDPQRALDILRCGTGIPGANFRLGQEEAIRHIVEGRGRLLVVEKTGWGKSFVYFIATKLLREAGRGPALLVSPLLSLMRNQILAARRMRVRAEMISSANTDVWPRVEEALDADRIDILLVAPERFANENFQEKILAKIEPRISLLVIDECHCISDWGHDFRPDYRLIERRIRNLPQNMRLLATTATANSRVMEDLQEVLGSDLKVQKGPLARPSLALQSIHLPRQSQRLAWLAEYFPCISGHGIIYTRTIRDAKWVAKWLQSRGIDAHTYTGEMENEEREELEIALIKNQVKALVATIALGMGFDKPDLGFVIHYQTPGSVVAYYQPVGRAGRALKKAYGVLLSGEEDDEITDYFIQSAFPSPDEVERVIKALEGVPEGLSHQQIQQKVNLTSGRISQTLKLVSLESPAPFVKIGQKWQLIAASLENSFWERVQRLTRLRNEEKCEMQNYVRLESGHMKFLIRALGGDSEGFQLPDLPPLSTEVSSQMEREALYFLRRLDLPINPRLQWPGGGLPLYEVRGSIIADHRANPGRALCLWGDGGWGAMVRDGKQKNNRFDDDLVSACDSLIRRWNPQPRPQWITCIPSFRNPDLVPDFTQRLAELLELPVFPILVKTEDRPPQKRMENSVHQARNVDGSLMIDSGMRIPPAPVLLVDDIVGSRWTFTIAAWLLRCNGSGPVFPFALSTLGRS